MEDLTDYAGLDGFCESTGVMYLVSIIIDFELQEAWQYKFPDDYPRDCNPRLVF